MNDRNATGSTTFTWRATLVAAICIIAMSFGGAALAQSHDHAATVVVAHDYNFAGPAELTPGWHYVTLDNQGTEPHHLQFARLKEGATPDEFFAALQSEGESALRMVTMTGGVGIIPPGGSGEVLVDFTQPGIYVELCFVPNSEGVPHLALGMAGVVVVAGQAAEVPEPTADIEVRMSDFSYSLPSTITPGPHTWKIVNDGPQPHEMLVFRLNDDSTVGDFMAALATGDIAALPGEVFGGAQGLEAGLASYIDYDLPGGNYVVICLIPDPASGQPHVALGMVAKFSVADTAAGN